MINNTTSKKLESLYAQVSRLCEQMSPTLSVAEVELFFSEIVELLFPISLWNKSNLYSCLEQQGSGTLALLHSILHHLPAHEKTRVVDSFVEALPLLHETLVHDAEAHLARDPAATTLAEVILCYPGFRAIAYHRVAHALLWCGQPLIARVGATYAQRLTGIDIHPRASIGKSFAIDHGTGVVIGETSTIGDNVTLYQGVTLGALSVTKDRQSTKRHPTVEDEVVIYANATVLGGDTTIGHNSVIGGNAWVVESVPPYSKVTATIRMKEDCKAG